MEFFKKESRINFMGYRRYTVFILTLLSILSIMILATKGLNLGLDFTGGTQIDARFASPMDPSEIRSQLEQSGLHGVKVQQYGSTQDFLIRVSNPSENENDLEINSKEAGINDTAINTAANTAINNKEINRAANDSQTNTAIDSAITDRAANATSVTNATNDSATSNPGTNDTENQELKISKTVREILIKSYPNIEIRRIEFVGSEVGEQLFEQGMIAVLMAIFATMIYIGFRFEYRLAVSAAVGLIHDAVLLLGIFAIFRFEFDLATLGSVLAVLGYSLNDTIVVFDRVRENFRKVRKGSPAEIMNLSINQTLSRTIMTSLLTLLVVLALLFFGGESLFGFSMAFFLGILIGTVSSIYVSGALALWMGLTRTDLMPKPKTEYEEGS